MRKISEPIRFINLVRANLFIDFRGENDDQAFVIHVSYTLTREAVLEALDLRYVQRVIGLLTRDPRHRQRQALPIAVCRKVFVEQSCYLHTFNLRQQHRHIVYSLSIYGKFPGRCESLPQISKSQSEMSQVWVYIY